MAEGAPDWASDPVPANAPQAAPDWAAEPVKTEPVKKEAAPAWAEEPPKGPMPGPFDALAQGIGAGIGEVKQSAEVLGGDKAPQPHPDTSPAAHPFEWGDVLEPWNKAAPKIAYRLGKSSPTLAAGIAGGIGGGAAGAAITGPGAPIGGTVGAIAGGTLGSMGGAALQTIGPVFAEELKKSPKDPDGAWDRAIQQAAISGAFSGASWAAFPIKAFQGPLKQLAFQALGVQPAIGMAQQAVQNVREGKPATENLGQAYTEGAVMTAVPAIGHKIIAGEPRAEPVQPRTSAELQMSIQDRHARAQTLDAEINNPNTPQSRRAEAMRERDVELSRADHEDDLLNAPKRIAVKNMRAEQFEQQAQDPKYTPEERAQLMQYARGFRDDALHDQYLISLPPPLPERGSVANWFINNIAPELASEKALQSDARFAEFKSSAAKGKDAAYAESERYRYRWNKVPEDDVYKFLKQYEGGRQNISPDLAAKYPWMQTEAADRYRKMLLDAFELESKYGSRASYWQDYFPHLWKDPEKARTVFTNMNIPQGAGSRWFQKHRFYEDIEAGMRAGLELKTTNPEDLITTRMLASVDMVERARLLQDLYKSGVAVPAEKAPPWMVNPSRRDPNPWQQVQGPNGKMWMLAPDVAPLWQNAVIAQGLWSNEGAIGKGFRGWMALKNAWVPIKLGLSLFHPVHVLHINFNSNLARAMNETAGRGSPGALRRMIAMPEALLQTTADTLFALPIGLPHQGKTVRKAWVTPEANQTPQQKAITRLVNEAGVSAQLSEQLRIGAKRQFWDAIGKNEYWKAVLPGLRRGLEVVSSPIFEHWIPNLKAAAVMREAESLMRRRPDIMNDDKSRAVAMRAIGKQIDNRFGEMFYGSLFWNRTLKDAAIGSFLSLGWNLGFTREFMGGMIEPAARRMMDAPSQTRQTVRDVTTKGTNLILYAATAMIANAMITKMVGGSDPEGMDYIFPRIGGLNPDGSPRRVSNPFYTREVPMAMKNVEERQGLIAGLSQMIYHKMMFAPIVEMATNRNYFGNQIYDSNAPAFVQAYQWGKNLINEQLNPMSIAGAKRSLELSGKPHSGMDVLKGALSGDSDALMPILGFGPAPSYASRGSIENRISYLFGQTVAAKEKPFREAEQLKERQEAKTAYLMAQQKKDPDAIKATAMKLAELGVPSATIRKIHPGGGLQYMFQRLPQSQQIDLLKHMDREQFRFYYPHATRKTKADPEITPLVRGYYGGG